MIMRIFVGIFVLLLVAGCSNSGNTRLAQASAANVHQTIVNGKTTKAEVVAMLGQPNDVDFNNNNDEKWSYFHNKSQTKAINFVPVVSMFSAGTDDFRKVLVIVFNKNDVVQNHVYTESKGETTTGLIG